MIKGSGARILIAGAGSGCGKTTVTCGLLSALKQRAVNTTAFKCGPDYIDPMFHSEVLGTKSRNLDVFLCGENTVKYLLDRDSDGSELSVIEGVMGIYDGAGFQDDTGSANHIARLTSTPELLVLNVRGKGLSLAAEAAGYLNFTENNIGGLILNNCSEAMYGIYKEMLKEKLGIDCYGFMPHIEEGEIGSRHLGLITADEIYDLKEKMARLGIAAESSLDIDGILALAAGASTLEYEKPELHITSGAKVRIAIARDKAFCFYYEDSLELLGEYGAELVPFSPLEDKGLPEDVRGVILGGGYPEVHAGRLSANKAMLDSVRKAADGGMPIYAECGGFMYLGKSIDDGENIYPMAGVVDSRFKLTNNLVRFGYKTLTANTENILCHKGDKIKCHEFHYSDTDEYGDCFTAVNSRGRRWKTTVASDNILAGYPHIHLWSRPEAAGNFVDKCRKFAEGAGEPWK